ncbi:MAG: AAA family ATPase [Chloroflexota bacterium]
MSTPSSPSSSRVPQSDDRRVVAVTGKGGAGKTLLAALIVGLLARRGDRRILAIDADSAVSLPLALGVPVGRTVGDIREELISDPSAKRRVEDIPMSRVIADALGGGRGIDLLVMGRPEGPGCFCMLNDLLRYGIESLSRDYDVTVIDCEAGPEQVNRRVVRSVDTLIVVSDTSARGLNTARVIKRVAESSGGIKPVNVGLVVNRVRPGSEGAVAVMSRETDLRVLGYIPEDDNVTRYDLTGRPLADLPDDSPAMVAVHGILRELGL